MNYININHPLFLLFRNSGCNPPLSRISSAHFRHRYANRSEVYLHKGWDAKVKITVGNNEFMTKDLINALQTSDSELYVAEL